MFQLLELTEAHVASVTNRVEKHGDEGVPAVSFKLEVTGPNTLLDMIDPKIREALYKAVDGQADVPGVESVTPVLRCNAFDKHTLPTKHEGWTFNVDDAVNENDPMTFRGVKVDKFWIDAKQGGSIVLGFRIGTSDVDADKLGKLAMHNGESIWFTLTAPTPKTDAIDGSMEAFERDHPDATDLFGAEHGPDESDSEGGDPDILGTAAEQPTDIERPEGWPFPKDSEALEETVPQSVTVEPNRRTKRGREATRAALEAGQNE